MGACHNGGMFDTVGSRLNFAVVAGVGETFRVSFYDGTDTMSVLGATFQAACYVAHGDEAGEQVAVLPVEHDARDNAVLLTVPELEQGHYCWELRASDPEGRESRLLYGTLSALSGASVARLGDEAEASVLRDLSVQVADGYAAPLRLRWQSCSAGASFAEQAARAAERAEGAAALLQSAQAFIESFEEAVSQAVRVGEDGVLVIGNYYTGVRVKAEDGVTPHIGANGNWWSGEQDLGKPSRGEDGLTPSISADGYWVLGDWKSPVCAAGRDGIDGTAVRRILVESVADLPQEGEMCNGGVYYYVPNAEGEYDVYAWLERRDSAGWVRVTQAYDIATAEVYGLGKLGTDSVAEAGAPVAVNGDGRMTVPPASAAEYGAFKASSTKVEKQGGAPIYLGDDGKFYVNLATTNKPGGVIYSAWGATPDNYCIGPNTSGWIDVMNAGEYQRGVVLRAAGLADVRDGAVPEAKQVKSYLDSNFLTIEETWTREQVRKYLADNYHGADVTWTREQVREHVAGELKRVTADAAKRYKTIEAAREEHEALDAAVGERLRKSDTVDEVRVLTLGEYQALKVRNEKCVYLITED